MKTKNILLFSALSLIFACNQKSTEKNENNDIITDTTEVFTYKHSDGRLIEIANIYSGEEASALVTINGKTENLPQISASDSTAVYQKGNLQLRSLYTNLYLKEDDKPEQELILINPITVSYQNEDENIIAEYHTTDKEKPYVILQLQDGNEYTLTQTEAFAKGATYANDSIQWSSNNDNATLKIHQKEITLKQIPLDEIMKPLQK